MVSGGGARHDPLSGTNFLGVDALSTSTLTRRPPFNLSPLGLLFLTLSTSSLLATPPTTAG